MALPTTPSNRPTYAATDFPVAASLGLCAIAAFIWSIEVVTLWHIGRTFLEDVGALDLFIVPMTAVMLGFRYLMDRWFAGSGYTTSAITLACLYVSTALWHFGAGFRWLTFISILLMIVGSIIDYQWEQR